MVTKVRALAVFAAVVLLAGPCAAAEPPATLTVAGEGTVTRAPDRATLGVTLISNSDDAQNATSANNKTYATLVSRMAALHVAESSIRTTSYDVSFVPKPDASAQYKPPRTGFIVTRQLQIAIDDMAGVGRAVDAAVAAGVTQIDGVTFGLRDRRAAYADALAAAMQDAESQATALAKAAHARLGAVRRIDAVRALPQASQAGVMLRAAASVPTELQPSQVEVRATVNVTYALQP